MANEENPGEEQATEPRLQSLSEAFRATLNRHGYGFQYAVLKHIDGLARKNAVPWLVEAAEFPVSFNGNTTHIDLVLKQLHYRQQEPVRIVGECKRANPALVDWCFVRTPPDPLLPSEANSVALERIFVEYVQNVGRLAISAWEWIRPGHPSASTISHSPSSARRRATAPERLASKRSREP